MEAARDAFRRLTNALNAGVITTQEASEAFAELGYDVVSTNLEGPRMEVRLPIRGGVDLNRGDLVSMSPDGSVRRALEWEVPIGVALEDGIMRIGGDGEVRVMVAGQLGRGDITRAMDRMRQDGYEPDYAIHASVARGHASIAYGSVLGGVDWRAARPVVTNRYKYTERFPKEVQNKAWNLLKQYMTDDQHFAFMEGANIELQNRDETYRLLINRTGKFTILQGDPGAGIVATAGKIYSSKYPLGDEIAAFLDWFNHKTEDLIAQWNCGAYGIRRLEELHRR